MAEPAAPFIASTRTEAQLAEPLRVLLVDDEDHFRRVVEYNLSLLGLLVIHASTGPEALDIFHRQRIDMVLTDMILPQQYDGMELLEKIHAADSSVPVVFITAYGNINTAVEAMQRGATDFITKPIDRDILKRKVMRALRTRRLEKENRELRAQLVKEHAFENIIGTSKAMEPIFRLMSRLVESDTSVLITGESGTGKELVARALHYKGPRAPFRFVAVNCSAIPGPLLESEMFGHVKGAFTGADHDRVGRFEAADKGTIFLDEIGEMPYDLQAKLLRVLQEREIERVGSQDARPVNVRVICSTHRDIEDLVRRGLFRGDLFYRLSVVPLKLPPLRDRIEDIPLLIRHFLQRCGHPDCRIEKEAYKILSRHNWPGNIRELENTIERAILMRDQDNLLTAADFEQALQHLPGSQSIPQGLTGAGQTFDIPDEGIKLDDVEKNLILRALEKTAHNQTRAAKLLGITRQTLIYRIQKHDIR